MLSRLLCCFQNLGAGPVISNLTLCHAAAKSPKSVGSPLIHSWSVGLVYRSDVGVLQEGTEPLANIHSP